MEAVQRKECDKAILVCGTGFGMTIVANKFKGIRCAPCYNEETAKFARMHNNINVLVHHCCFGIYQSLIHRKKNCLIVNHII